MVGNPLGYGRISSPGYKRLNRQSTLPPPFFKQTCSEVGEERDEFSPIEVIRPEFFFFFFFCLNIISAIYTEM